MPANRSRTERWRESLQQIFERGGGIEFSYLQEGQPLDDRPPDLVWRVRIVRLTETEIMVEEPSAAGRKVHIEAGSPLLGVMSIGQNRWQFKTRVLRHREASGSHGPAPAMVIEMPASVERQVRRQYARASTSALRLPRVECYPLLNPTSVGPAEIANRAQVHDLHDEDLLGAGSDGSAPALLLPEVGPMLTAELANIGGGGVGLKIARADAQGLDTTRLLWLRIDLRPAIPAPIAVTAKVVHSHIDALQDVYLGLAFDFTYNPSHQAFVTDELVRFVGQVSKAA